LPAAQKPRFYQDIDCTLIARWRSGSADRATPPLFTMLYQ
jgi:hypothetical protein